MARDKHPVTQAVRFLRKHKVEFTHHPYPYEEKGGTRVSSRELGVSEHEVVKSLVFQEDSGAALMVLMHGDRSVSEKELARTLGCKRVQPCEPKIANKVTGYQVGGISPFGTRQRLRVFVESSILELDRIYINGGKRGYLVGLDPKALPELLGARQVQVGR